MRLNKVREEQGGGGGGGGVGVTLSQASVLLYLLVKTIYLSGIDTLGVVLTKAVTKSAVSEFCMGNFCNLQCIVLNINSFIYLKSRAARFFNKIQYS